MKTQREFLLFAFAFWLISLPVYSTNLSDEWQVRGKAAIPHAKALYALDNHIDSVIIRNEHDTSRVIFVFNNEGSLSQKSEEKYIGNIWVNHAKSLYTYDGEGKLNTLTDLLWVNSQWENVQQNIYNYDNNDHNNAILKQDWMNNAWVNFELKEMAYDSIAGKLTAVLIKNWDSAAWYNNYLTTYFYDANGNLAEEYMLNYVDTLWENAVKFVYSYDNNNHMLTMKHSFWIDNDWTFATYFNYTWDLNGHCESWLRQVWNGTGWSDENFSLFTYDQSGNCIERINKNWFNNTWEIHSKYTYVHMAGHIKGTAYLWDGAWNPGAGYLEITQYQDGAQHELFAAWGMSVDYYCSDLTTDVCQELKPQSETISAYPNPARDVFALTYHQPQPDQLIIKLYSITGEMIRCLYQGDSKPGSQKFNFRVDDIPCGIYILEVQNSREKYCRKLNIVR